jgi:hypothetical protein
VQLIYLEGASEDGEKVFFATRAELTKEDEGSSHDQLYEYEEHAPAGMRLTLLSKGVPDGITSTFTATNARGESVFSSSNGATVYFFGVDEELYRINTVTRELDPIAHASPPTSGAIYSADGDVTPAGTCSCSSPKGSVISKPSYEKHT